MKNPNFKIAFIAFFCFVSSYILCQNTYFGENPVKWDNKPFLEPQGINTYSGSAIVILSDKCEFHFYEQNNEKITRRLLLKINTDEGKKEIETLKLPESFDKGFDCSVKQGKQSKIKTPYIYDYRILKLGARKFSSQKWTPLLLESKYEPIKWVQVSGDDAGRFITDQLRIFNFKDLAVGDIIEIYYEATFEANYGSNLFYLNDYYPKLKCNYSFIYKVSPQFVASSFIKPININDSLINWASVDYGQYSLMNAEIEMNNLAGINYRHNSGNSKTLPCVYADFSYYRTITGSHPSSDGERIYETAITRPRNFEWVIFTDTANYYARVNDKQSAAIRKFVSQLPPVVGPDSTSTHFFRTLCDTLNEFRYLSSNHLYYNEPGLANVFSGDHLLKRRLVQHFQWKIYQDVLNDNSVFYYIVNAQDTRLGEHNMNTRVCRAYEKNFIAIPKKNSFIYFLPRYGGVKYHLNELPFYLEGSLAQLRPRNFQTETKDKSTAMFKFIKTPKSTHNENTRTESVNALVSIDSLKTSLTIKESLSGQFSTLLRHLYLKETIDSTIADYYFKKAVDKPLAKDVRIKLASKSTDAPFRYNFNCTETIPLLSNNSLSLKDWFSFVPSGKSIPVQPTHDYYFDFVFSDVYNFMFDFQTPVEVTNKADFKSDLTNDYYELRSDITELNSNAILLKVSLVIKQHKIPVQDAALLMNLVDRLDQLNSKTLTFSKK
ncbi:MAG: hypothetical protein JNL60_04895 [Bacteroidia bacterium]|nr:hypothetical protein [Bacteroidia bacterium]